MQLLCTAQNTAVNKLSFSYECSSMIVYVVLGFGEVPSLGSRRRLYDRPLPECGRRPGYRSYLKAT